MHVDKHKIFGHIDMMQAIGKSIAVLLAYLVGMYVTGRFHSSSNYLGAILACTSAIVVFQGAGGPRLLLQGMAARIGNLHRGGGGIHIS